MVICQHFVHETPPVADMDEAVRAENAPIMALGQQVLYKGLAGTPVHTRL